MRQKNPILRTRKLQQVSMHRELVNLAVFLTQYFLIEEMHYTEAEHERKISQLVQQILGGPDSLGLLQEMQNKKMDRILDRLREDMPDIKHEEVLVFSYALAGFTNTLSYHLAGMSCENAVSTLKGRLRSRIILLRSPHKAEYLALLPERACRIGEERNYLPSAE